MTAGRLLIIGFGLFGIAAGLTVLAISPPRWNLQRTSERILHGERYSSTQIAEIGALTDGPRRARFADPHIRRAIAIIDFEAARRSTDEGDPAVIDRAADALSSSVRLALVAAPTDPFLWLIFFWAENTRTGFSAGNLDALRLSHAFGPNEGWIILRRSALSLPLYPSLPGDLAGEAVADLRKLMKNGLYKDVVRLLLGPGRNVHARLLPALAAAPVEERQELVAAFDFRGYKLDLTQARIDRIPGR